ncbi:MAG: lactonase family protein [Verrucomicrobia bacterium]|nr:lactonase family protein [Verrucomicrobiota bacterium]
MTLRTLFRTTLLTALGLAMALGQATAAPTTALVCFGSYSTPDKESVHLFQLDLADGSLKKLSAVDGLKNPSFLKIHPSGRYLYTVNEVSTFDGKRSGGVTAFALDVQAGKLTRLNQQPSGDTGPCHLTVDATGKFVLVAHYGGGSTSVLPVKDDGSVGAVVSQIKHTGSSVTPRQKAPHAHAVHVGPNNQFAFAPDLGIDKVLVFRFDEKTGAITETKFGGAKLEPGSGPRHFGFHPSGKFAYVINELKQTVTAFRYRAKRGRLQTLQTVSTVPHPVEGNSTAELLVHPSGKFLYGSNRGHNSIAMFRIDQKTGKLTALGHEATRGEIPRNFGIDPTGQYLLAANQRSNNVAVFRINQDTGKLKFTGNEIQLSKPVCVRTILQD